MSYIETSAKTGLNVKDAFIKLSRKVVKIIPELDLSLKVK